MTLLANHLPADHAVRALRADVDAGLRGTPKSLPPKWFYDETGSALFDRITRLPEYYPTRTEAAILAERAGEIAAGCPADTLIELGSGTSAKTRMLIDALRERGTLDRFVPVDVDATVLAQAQRRLGAGYPGLRIDAVCGDFERHLHRLPRGGRRLMAFLGSTIGNLTPGPRAEFLATVAAVLAPGDALLLGVDLVKDTGRLIRAYDDAAGVTAAFNRNVLTVINRELRADFDPDAFAHVARWNAEQSRMEMWLRADTAQHVRIAELDLGVDFAAGEELLTEVSGKFTRAGIEAELAAAGLRGTHWWTDPAGDFALTLAHR